MHSSRLNESYPAVADTIPLARGLVTDYAAAAGLAEERLDALRLAVSEAVSNVVIHAYRDGAGEVRVRAKVASDELSVVISDSGCGHETPPQAPGLGFGFALMADACEEFSVVERSEGGTEVSLVFLLPVSEA